jgi:hypothetical protein
LETKELIQLLSYFSFAFCTLLSNPSNLKESGKMGLFFVAVSKELLSFFIVVLLFTQTLQGLIDRYGASLDTLNVLCGSSQELERSTRFH